MKNIEYCSVFFFIVAIKLVAFVALHFFDVNHLFSGGNDSDYYHKYAMYKEGSAVNSWASLLRLLHEIGLYSRTGVSTFLKCLNILVLPFLVAYLVYIKGSPAKRYIFWCAAIIIGAYPTLLYYSFDIYRDLFMVFIWLLSLFLLKFLSVSPNICKKIIVFFIAIAASCVLYDFRPYLGFAYAVSLLFASFYSFKKNRLWLLVGVWVFALFVLYISGYLNIILNYRALFNESVHGSSNLGLDFSSALHFIPDLLLTVVFQMFGVFFPNMLSIIIFLVESLPFTFFLIYVIKNRRFSNKFVDYLVVFFLVYSTIWLLGNDNLGTSIRLRIFSYISIFIAFCVIYQNKAWTALKFHSKLG